MRHSSDTLFETRPVSEVWGYSVVHGYCTTAVLALSPRTTLEMLLHRETIAIALQALPGPSVTLPVRLIHTEATYGITHARCPLANLAH